MRFDADFHRRLCKTVGQTQLFLLLESAAVRCPEGHFLYAAIKLDLLELSHWSKVNGWADSWRWDQLSLGVNAVLTAVTIFVMWTIVGMFPVVAKVPLVAVFFFVLGVQRLPHAVRYILTTTWGFYKLARRCCRTRRTNSDTDATTRLRFIPRVPSRYKPCLRELPTNSSIDGHIILAASNWLKALVDVREFVEVPDEVLHFYSAVCTRALDTAASADIKAMLADESHSPPTLPTGHLAEEARGSAGPEKPEKSVKNRKKTQGAATCEKNTASPKDKVKSI